VAEKIAVIDLGSNSVRMNIILINDCGGYSVFDQAKEMVRLSEGLHVDGFLKQDPMDRTIKALNYFKRLIEVNNITKVHAVSTAAVRMAKNKNTFIERVKRETGFDFRVISGEEEAYYDFLGVANTIDFKDAVLLDIGGASTEIMWVKNRELVESISIPLGSVILTEQFAKIKSMKVKTEAAHAYLKSVFEDIPWLKEVKDMPIIGLGGVIRAVGKVDRNAHRYPLENVHNYHLERHEVDDLIKLVHETPMGDLDKIEGISKKRADIMSMGIMPLKALIDYIEPPELIISGKGLRDGLFYEVFFKQIGQAPVVENVLEHSSQNMLKRYSTNMPHAKHVQMLALKLFDQLNPIHAYSDKDRKILGVASLLHDIGMHIEFYDHHIHGMYLLVNSGIDGLTDRETLAVAYLIGNHRSINTFGHLKDYDQILDKEEATKLLKLANFLQIAEQLDRDEFRSITDLQAEITEKRVYLRVISDEFPELDILSAMRFADRFYKYYKYELSIFY